LQQVAAEQQAEIEAQKRKEAIQQAELQRRQKEWEEIRKQKELAKAEAEKEAERVRRRLAAEEFEREKIRVQQEKELEEERKKEARKREIEAAIAREEHKKATEAILMQQQAIVERKRIEMEERDKKRQAEMAEKRLAALVENEEMRLRTAVRIQNAIEAQKSILIKKRMEFEERSRRNEERKREFEEYQQQKIEATRAKGAQASNCLYFDTNMVFSILGSQRAAEIRTVLTRMEELEEEKRQATLDKERQSLQILERIKFQNEHDNMTKAEMARLRQFEKMDMVSCNIAAHFQFISSTCHRSIE
jgi:hypothetical protein